MHKQQVYCSETQLGDLVFVDVIVLISDNVNKVQETKNILFSTVGKLGLKINQVKTKLWNLIT